jgi:hypothetical protein
LSATANQTKQRMIATIYSPFAAIQRRRKKTKAERRAQKAFRTITFIVGFFALLWSPYYIVATIYGFCKEGCIPSVIYTLSYYMWFVSDVGTWGDTEGTECTSQRVGKNPRCQQNVCSNTRWQRRLLPTRCEVHSVPPLPPNPPGAHLWFTFRFYRLVE